MIEPIIVVTNNPMSKENLSSKYVTEFIDGSTIDVFKKVRSYIHNGHKLLTHPLMSSIKPNETPYRTVIISKNREKAVEVDSLKYIEEGISSTEKFTNKFGIPNWSEQVLEDFQLIDYDLIYHALY
ncbi:GrdX family protein [Clostridium sp. CX1]|uniref:GrdX family protein n=1 Tax=Clostridium tanneri TaxID=3037988 RepID=A0ABU4JRG8_9CLOT|nr:MULTISPECIES: GrdX family protein [unclassified Clostridium]MCT8975884.1 GrdX family protein [Clostridium sp. CX1]MDW8800740.1 GrdX family protein [Clostridium sp. A1-XYC3]